MDLIPVQRCCNGLKMDTLKMVYTVGKLAQMDSSIHPKELTLTCIHEFCFRKNDTVGFLIDFIVHKPLIIIASLHCCTPSDVVKYQKNIA